LGRSKQRPYGEKKAGAVLDGANQGRRGKPRLRKGASKPAAAGKLPHSKKLRAELC